MSARRAGTAVALGLALLWPAGPAAADPAQLADGQRLFRGQCLGCHSLGVGENRAGPTLHGLVGRRSGTVDGYDFSPAMREAAIDWTPENLDAFLTSPRDRVPGTKMVFWGLEPDARRSIIGYLESFGEGDGPPMP